MSEQQLQHGVSGPDQPVLRVVRAARGDVLAAALADALAQAPADPFATEIVAVPTPGVERWLAQSLATRLGTSPRSDGGIADDGVCAGVAFPTLGRLLTEVEAGVTGLERRDDPWAAPALTWTVLAVLLEQLHEPWLAPVAAHLGAVADHALRPGRRWSTARRLAGLFAGYADQRPSLLAEWAAGRDAGVDADLAWQPQLWRTVRDRIAETRPGVDDPVRRLDTVTRALATDPAAVDLPERLFVFGPTRLSVRQRALLTALGRHRDVSLWLIHPSPALWSAVADASPTPVTRADDPGVEIPRNRLNARLGRDMRELQTTLGAVHDEPIDVPGASDTLLHRLQRSVRDDVPPGTERAPIAATDDSVSVHASHGPDRQVEVLRDVLAGLLADDPSLEPRDIVVMCPDIERIAPLVAARFALDPDREPTHPGQRFRVRLADRSLDQVNPLLGLLRRLLDLQVSRNTASDLLDLCSTPALRRRFRFSEDDLARIGELVTRSGMRWGVDVGDRARFGMDGFAQNTWATGLDRLLTGVTLSEDDLPVLGRALPLDEVDSGDVDLVGRLTELVVRVRQVLQAFSQPQPLPAWTGALRQALDLLTAVPGGDSWQYAHAYGVLADLADTAEGSQVEVTPGDVRAVFDATLTGRPSRSNFRTGTLTMCTLSPMRSVPHRVVCLIGLDDGLFPRSQTTDGDDVLAREPRVGERDPRSEDRQLLLDAVMAAQDKLVVIYSGADPRTNAERPPSVPLQELLDALDDITPPGAQERIIHRHPLQAFSAANFARTGAGPLSFDTAALAGAVAAAGERRVPAAERPMPSWAPVAVPEHVEFDALVRFFRHPARAFLRSRLGLVDLDGEEEESIDQIPVELDGLRRWAIGNRMVQLALGGADPARVRQVEWLRGTVPPQQLGTRIVEHISGDISGIWRQAADVVHQTPTARDLDVTVEVPAGLVPGWGERRPVRLSGVITGMHDLTATTLTYSRISATTRINAWLTLVALTADSPQEWRCRTIGRGGSTRLGPIPPEVARQSLALLVGLYLRGQSEPVLLPPRTALNVAELRRQGRDWQDVRARETLQKQWTYDHDPLWARFVGPDITDLMAAPTPPGLEEFTGTRCAIAACADLAITPMLRAEAQ